MVSREPATVTDAELERLVGTEPADTPPPPTAWSEPGRVLLASLLVAAGAIHLVMVPSHASEWLPEGIAFALAGWLQIGLAVLVVTKPSRSALAVACVANLVFIGAWAWSRAAGLPFGPEAGAAHAASFIDLACVGLEAGAVIVAGVLLVRPRLGADLGNEARALLSIVPVGVLVLATAAIASPSAAGHGHDGEMADGHGHAHDEASTVDDKGLSLLMNGQGEGGGHTHEVNEVALDAATQAELDAQLAQTQTFVEQYPTLADAEAGGFVRQGPFSPGLGTHYSSPSTARSVNMGPGMTDEALARPTLIYDGIGPDAKLAGFMYNIFSLDTENPPEGFAGSNDQWHFHTNVCIVVGPDGSIDAPLGADTEAPKELCDNYGGILIDNTGYMVHVWSVPGYESPQGMFSNVNQKITCPNGTYYTVPLEEIGTRSNICLDVPA